jgi:pyruvate kinase
VQPLHFQVSNDRDAALTLAERTLLDQGLVKRGDLIVVTVGEPMNQPGGTNSLKVVRVGEHA